MTPFLALTLASLPTLASAPIQPVEPQEATPGAPPGLILVEGGTTKLGTPVKEVEKLIQENHEMANVLVSETPQVSEKVSDFYLMPTEVTNEQYAVYVEFAHIKPPYTWADSDAIAAARKTFLEERGKAIAEARAKGHAFDAKKFEPEAWWDEAWETTEWSVPDALAEHPANFVDFPAALAYATWAGLRLPTEAEWTRAGRGNSADVYPWGKEDDASDKAHTVEQPMAETRPVGSFPNGARNGIYDLAGNVWEWTNTPFGPFDGYKPMRVKVGRGNQNRPIEALASWEPSFRVLKGGAFQNPLLAARVATRMPGLKSQSTEGIGFRCAASTHPGEDTAIATLTNDILMSAMPADLNFNPGRTVIMQSWTTKAGKVSERIEGYSIIKSYERGLFFPVEKIQENSLKNLDAGTAEEPIVFGVLSLSIPTMNPPLDAGTYVVAYRAAGKMAEEDPAAAANPNEQPTTLRFKEALGFDAELDQFFIFDGEGNPLATMPANKPSYEKEAPGTATLVPFEAPKRPDKKNPVTPMDTLRFKAVASSSNKRKGFAFTLDIGIAPGAAEGWK